MRSYLSLAIAVFFCLLGQAHGEGKYWRFKAETNETLSNPSGALNGEYEVISSSGTLEAFQLTGGQREPIGRDAAEELKRMVGAYAEKDARKYVSLPLEVGKKWSATYSTSSSFRTYWKTVHYDVVSREQLSIPAGLFSVFQIKGNTIVRGIAESYNQEWIGYFSPELDSFVEWRYDSAVGKRGAKIYIKLVGTGKISEPIARSN